MTRDDPEVLSQHRGNVSLNSLSVLTDGQARVLASHVGFLFLDGVSTLSDEQADALARHEGSLSLEGLTRLSQKQAEAFSKHVGSLFLDGLEVISDEVAEALAAHSGVLSLDGLTTLSDTQAEALAKHVGGLSLNRLPTLSIKQAEAFANYRGSLSLASLTMLSNEAAQALARFQGDLYIRNVATLSANAAELFSRQLWSTETCMLDFSAMELSGAMGDVDESLPRLTNELAEDSDVLACGLREGGIHLGEVPLGEDGDDGVRTANSVSEAYSPGAIAESGGMLHINLSGIDLLRDSGIDSALDRFGESSSDCHSACGLAGIWSVCGAPESMSGELGDPGVLGEGRQSAIEQSCASEADLTEEEIRNRDPAARYFDLAHSVCIVADTFVEQGKYGDAEILYAVVLEACERDLGREHPSLAEIREKIAAVQDAKATMEHTKRPAVVAVKQWGRRVSDVLAGVRGSWLGKKE